MSSDHDVSSWELLQRASDVAFYLIEDRIIGVVPEQGLDTRADGARAHMDVLVDYANGLGNSVGCIAILDRMTGMDKASRTIYKEGLDPAIFYGVALVGGTLLARAIGSFFFGLARPACPISMFGKYGDALEWMREHREPDLS